MSQTHRVVWIALFKGIGDAVLFAPALKRSQQLFPGAQLSVILENENTAQVLRLYGFEGPLWILPRGVSSLLVQLLRLGLRSYDVVLDASSSQQMHLSRWLALALGKRRIGYHYGSSSRLYTHPLSTEPIGRVHEKDIFMKLLEPFGPQPHAALVPPPPRRESLDGLDLGDSRLPRIVIHPGGRDGLDKFEKRWPISSYVVLLERLRARSVNLILVGSKAEAPWIRERFQESANTINLAGKTTVAQLFELIRQAALFVGNNSGPMHAAAAFGIPIVTFAGGIPLTRWGPAGPRNTVLGLDKRCRSCPHYECDQGGLPCLEAITVEEALHAVEQALAIADRDGKS